MAEQHEKQQTSRKHPTNTEKTLLEEWDEREACGLLAGWDDASFSEKEEQQPSVSLLTAIAVGDASAAERQVWDEKFASCPEARARLEQLEAFMESDQALAEQEAMLSRGAALLEDVDVLPEDFWENEEGDWKEETSVTVAESWEENPIVVQGDLGEPESSLEAPVESSVSSDLWTPSASSYAWGGALTLCAVLALVLWQGPWSIFSPQDKSIPKGKPSIIRVGPNALTGKGNKDGGQRDATHNRLVPKPPLTNHAPRTQFMLLAKGPQGMRSLTMETSIRSGTQLVIRYSHSSTQKRAFLLLFSIDRKGSLSPIYPAKKGKPFVLKSANAKFLPDGVEMFVEGAERVFACVSQQPISYAKVESFVAEAFKTNSIETLKRLPFACDVQQTWLLREAKTTP